MAIKINGVTVIDDSRIGNLAAATATGNIVGGNITTGGLITATGNIQGGNLRTGGLISATGSITGASVVGGVMTGTSLSVSGTVTSASVVGGVMSGSSLTVSTGSVTCGSIVNANANGVGNIGSATTYFNTVFAKATSAQYADLAEMYEADQIIEPGTVVCFGGDREVTVCDTAGSKRVAGVVSTNPSYIMNAGLQGENVVAVALTGRVPTKVTGAVRKGDMMVSAGLGRARAETNPEIGSVIGKALADFDGAEGVIEVVIGRL